MRSVDLSDYELASRLSYFLWSSMPDDELFALAGQGKLCTTTQSCSSKSAACSPIRKAKPSSRTSSRSGSTCACSTAPRPIRKVFPQFDAELKAAMRRETELFAAAIIREDRSILDFLTGRFTFVNERLAKHYGIDGISGDEFQRVELHRQSPHRRAHAGQHPHAHQQSRPHLARQARQVDPGKHPRLAAARSAAGRARSGSDAKEPSPTRRSASSSKSTAQNAVCASCHKVMDQLGFGLENFDAIGRWREKDGKFAIDASGELPGGAKFNGPLGLAKVLDKRRGEFVRCLTEKMLTFALGRELARARPLCGR